jgi:hypothetical protein
MERVGAIAFEGKYGSDRSSPIHLASSASDATYFDRRSKSLEEKFMVCDKHPFVHVPNITNKPQYRMLKLYGNFQGNSLSGRYCTETFRVMRSKGILSRNFRE